MTTDADLIPADYWPLLSKIESNDRPYVKAATSSGSGLYQFLKSTWIGEGGQWGNNPALAFGGLRPSPEEQTQRARTFTAKNVAILKAKGIPINKASLYAAHFFGAGMAAQVIKADVTARADLLSMPRPHAQGRIDSRSLVRRGSRPRCHTPSRTSTTSLLLHTGDTL